MPPAARAASAVPSKTTLFRIFLHDGTPLVSYGEFARVGDRVVFSMPVGERGGAQDLRLVQIPASSVDWDRTDRYTDSLRYQHYVATRAASDYAALTSEVAAAMASITRTSDPAGKLKTAEAIRGEVADWPREHFGYRADDVRQILELLDGTIAGLRASNGEQHFALSLVAGIAPPPIEPALPPPTPQQAIAQVLEVARLSPNASQRVSLLSLAVAQMDVEQASLPHDWLKSTRHDAGRMLDEEQHWTREYRDLARGAMDDAARRAKAADVSGVQAVVARVRHRDEQWGHRRPDQVASLLAELQTRLDAAQRLRLARDHWNLRWPVLRAYDQEVHGVLMMLDRARPALDAIKSLSGPDAQALEPLERKLTDAVRRMSAIVAPPEMTTAHALLTSAARLAEQAAAIRIDAAESGQLSRAWDASSAAAGSLMLIDRARHELETQLQPPPSIR